MTIEAFMVGLVVIAVAGQLLITMQVRDRIETLTEEVKKQKG